MTDSTAPARPQPDQPERLSLSATQIVASGLAAVSATVAASYFGIAGTVIGAGLGSVISVVGSAVYSYSIRKTHSRVRQGLDVAVAHRFSLDPAAPGAGERADSRLTTVAAGIRSSFSPRRLALAAGGLFLLVLAVTTGFELASGRPLAATVSGKQGSGTSLDGGHTSNKPSPPAGSTGVRSASTSPSGSSPSATPTVTVTVPASSAPASSTPSSDGSASDPPSSSPTSAPTG